MIHLDGDVRRTTLQSYRMRVVPDRTLLDALRALVGRDGVRVRGGWMPERKKPRQWGARRSSEEPVEA
jgi:hypothetical protein